MCEEAQWTLGYAENDVNTQLAPREHHGPGTMQISLYMFTSLEVQPPTTTS